jgi:hypothetical protein
MTNFAPGRGGVERDPQTLANHRFFAGNPLDMLRRCVRVDVEVRYLPDSARVRVRVAASDVGHRVPTGFVDRHLILTLEALGPAGQPLKLLAGPTLPPAAGDLAGQPGKLYAKLMRDAAGRSPAPFWTAEADPVADTRLTPGRSDELLFRFPAEFKQVRVRLLHRRFWREVVRAKGWPEEQLVVVDRVVGP